MVFERINARFAILVLKSYRFAIIAEAAAQTEDNQLKFELDDLAGDMNRLIEKAQKLELKLGG